MEGPIKVHRERNLGRAERLTEKAQYQRRTSLENSEETEFSERYWRVMFLLHKDHSVLLSGEIVPPFC